jgi:hypothetical protein
LWKQALLVFVIGAVAFALYKAANELWDAAERILSAFAALLGVLVQTLPSVFVARRIALGGVWVINNVDPSSMHLPSFFRTSHRTARTTFCTLATSHRVRAPEKSTLAGHLDSHPRGR